MSYFTLGCIALSCTLASGASEPAHGCFASIAAALAQDSAAGSPGADGATGFRVESRHQDALLHRSWANVLRCDHPERPAMTVAVAEMDEPARLAKPLRLQREAEPQVRAVSSPVAGQIFSPVSGAPVMLAGSVVRLVRTEANLRFDTAGIAQSNGAMGERVRVRLTRTGDSAGEAPQFLSGTVRSADVVEMEP
jgi:hypothetical protein